MIGVVGYPASGKGEFSRIAHELGIPVVVMGDAIREAVKAEGIPLTDLNLGTTAQRLRAEYGSDIVARLCIPLIERQRAPVVLVDGIRSDREVEVFRSRFKDFHLIGLKASFATRMKRLMERGRSDDARAAEELQMRDDREEGWGLARAMAMADCIVENEQDLGRFRALARQMMEELTRDAV
ncbi:MAG: AAA family ATPase [Methanomicrobiales archaeon]|nr:AAA family ATPase [Methanomicrobiales archaeon]